MSKPGSTALLCAAFMLLGSTAMAIGGGAALGHARAHHTTTASTGHRATPRANRTLARASVAHLARNSEQVAHWLRTARTHHQRARARCLDGLLSQTHAVEQLGRAALRAIEHGRRAATSPQPQLARIATFAARSSELRAEAEACGQHRHHEPRLPTGYVVRVYKPALPKY